MNFSYEELYAMYGQYDTNIHITFHYNAEAYRQFGANLMGTIIYTEGERNDLEQTLKNNPVPRTEKKIRILPSEVIKLSAQQYEQAERFGFMCSDIYEILSYNKPRTNEFKVKEKKEIKGKVIELRGWSRSQHNRTVYGFLNARFKTGERLAPEEMNEYVALRSYFDEDNTIEPFANYIQEHAEAVRLHGLQAQMTDGEITEEEIKELAQLTFNKYMVCEALIEAEIKRSNQKLEEVARQFGDELKNLKRICHSFNEDVLLYTDPLIYLDLERFIHIYARHVAETSLGGNYEGKTVFQYKFDDIKKLIELVVGSVDKEIEEHFKASSDKTFVRMGKRSVYFEGHYYRVEIEPSGRLLTFHPYNNNEERDADGEG